MLLFLNNTKLLLKVDYSLYRLYYSISILKRPVTLRNKFSKCLTSNLDPITKEPVYKVLPIFKSILSTSSSRQNELPLTKRQAQDIILHLTSEERIALLAALQEFESEKKRAEYEGQLAGFRWRSKFGRPSKLPTLGDVDPTGTYCPVPEDWLMRKYAESVPVPNTKELFQVALHNAIPFIGFGFLDNFFMIIAGDRIETLLGSMMVLSTMAAAALGNTISDVLGIGSAWYVERLAAQIGIKAPDLSPIQLDMNSSRWASNLGRVVGVCLGCLLGMFPLMFIGKKREVKEDDSI